MKLDGVPFERITQVQKGREVKGDYVLYWMQQSQRAEWNHALEYAIARANEKKLPLLVLFVVVDSYLEANIRHYEFMLQGLREVGETLRKRGVKFVVERGQPATVVPRCGHDATLVVFDRGYLRHQRSWRREVAQRLPCEVVEIESDAVVPVETASPKKEYAARTIRRDLMRQYESFVERPSGGPVRASFSEAPGETEAEQRLQKLTTALNIDRSVAPVSGLFQGGTAVAKKRLKHFLQKKLGSYTSERNSITADCVSHMSPYLHFGQISAAFITSELLKSSDEESRSGYLDELLVRRELAINFVWHEPNYDSFAALPGWAQKTLREHKRDPRPVKYSLKQLETAETDDRVWNAAMLQMKHQGYLHNTLRMYWGKKILEWSNSPEHAHKVALLLNNKYFLDGRDANSYTNILWLFGLHDRPWTARSIFGTVRYMSREGLERKQDVYTYLDSLQGQLNETIPGE